MNFLLLVYLGVNVVVFTSNCKAAGATARTNYVEELMRHIKVAIIILLLFLLLVVLVVEW